MLTCEEEQILAIHGGATYTPICNKENSKLYDGCQCDTGDAFTTSPCYCVDLQGNVIKVKYRGVWLISDNGYLNWSTTIPPFKETNSFGHLLFSEWVESMQKDIECAFGILKGRFRILKYGMRFHKVEHCDMLFKTLCALHNLLIKEDRLDTNWMGFEESLQEDQVSRNKFPSMLLRLHSLYVENCNTWSRTNCTRYQSPKLSTSFIVYDMEI